MNKILDIPIQKLFLVTLILKLFSSGIGWYFNRPWDFGFFIPLTLMAGYIVLGMHRRDTTVTDEKFADTCYYLGFIFTISSIIFSLFDLPNIGTKIQEIAVRFGAAMVSTVLGLGVRVYLVSFKQDIAEALIIAEDAALEATRRLGEQMGMALESLRDFEHQVHAAAKMSVERVNMEVENLSQNHAEKLNDFFIELSDRNQEAFTLALAEVRNVSRKLSDSVDEYAGGMQRNMVSIEKKVSAFTDAITTRLETTTFPDDYFARQLQGPMSQLKESTQMLAGGVKQTSDEVSESTVILSKALNKLRLKAVTAEAALDSVSKLTVQQQAVLDSAGTHIETLGGLSNVLAKVETALSGTAGVIRENSAAATHLVLSVSQSVAEGAATRKGLEASLGEVIDKLHANANATLDVAKILDTNAIATSTAAKALGVSLHEGSTSAQTAAADVASRLVESILASNSATAKLGAAVDASSLLVDKLDAISVVDARTANSLSSLTEKAKLAAQNNEISVVHLTALSKQLGAVEAAVLSYGADLKLVANGLAKAEYTADQPENNAPAPAAGMDGEDDELRLGSPATSNAIASPAKTLVPDSSAA